MSPVCNSLSPEPVAEDNGHVRKFGNGEENKIKGRGPNPREGVLCMEASV
jgi:hypothetical protein